MQIAVSIYNSISPTNRSKIEEMERAWMCVAPCDFKMFVFIIIIIITIIIIIIIIIIIQSSIIMSVSLLL